MDNLHSGRDESTSSLLHRHSGATGLLASKPHPPSTSATQSRAKLFGKPFAPNSSQDVQLGMEVLVTRSRGQIGRGVVRYVGPIPGRRDTYIGVELGPGQGKYTL